ncbi:hypothetical protein [Neisseria dentiae]|uniref:hypothetical protein n=1 Tax=Neisseria dentiae TaxID=194197 RepID=UPI0035A13D48
MAKIRTCGVKNARKMFNLAALFALHLQIFTQKTASQAFWLHSLAEHTNIQRPLQRFHSGENHE